MKPKTSLPAIVALACGAVWAAEAAGDPAARLVGAAATGTRAWDRLAWLSDRIGHRLSGSESLERAVDWAVAEFERDGLDRVWTDPVRVPHWVRGDAEARMVAPISHPIALLALGGSVGTDPAGLEAPVVAVSGFEELETRRDEVRGKIVLFDRAMNTASDYGTTARLRVHGAARAAEYGAVAMLIRSLGTADYRLPHTGAMRYAEGTVRIPAAAIAAEDAALIHRLLDAGDDVRVALRMTCRTLPDADSHNVLAEIRGRELPDEIVLVGAHLDSWDVGQGAHDDGSGCVVVMETMRLLRELGLRPRRTIRAVLFTNEENGLRGGKDYAERYGADAHVAAIESDSGGAAPRGFGVSAGEGGVALVREIAARLAVIGADHVADRGGGADISPLKKLGVPVMSLRQDVTRYFDYHHTEADTLDKVDRRDLDRNVAAMAWMAFALADHERTLPRLEPEASE